MELIPVLVLLFVPNRGNALQHNTASDGEVIPLSETNARKGDPIGFLQHAIDDNITRTHKQQGLQAGGFDAPSHRLHNRIVQDHRRPKHAEDELIIDGLMEPAITGGPGPIISRVHTDHLPHRHLNNGLGPLVDRVHGNQLPYGHILPEIPERNDPEILDSSTVIISPEKQEERPGPLPGGLTWHQWKKMQETACSNGGPCRGIESIRYAWHHLRNLKRHQVSRMPRPTDTPLSVGGFLHSCTFVEIAIFVVVMSTFIAVYGFAVDWPTSKTPHFMPLMVWIGMGVVCTVVVGGTLGIPTATMWGTGYVMELIFSVENVFCFHIVMQAFKTPVRLEQKLLVLCIIFQVVFQAIIFCGLGHLVATIRSIPYILGAWLLYVGAQAAFTDHSSDFDIRESRVFEAIKFYLGSRFSPHFPEDGRMFKKNDGKMVMTMVGPVFILLTLVDFAMEVDVTMTKIETIEGSFICFTSSVVAAVALPELFFVAQTLFQRFKLLKYGISFVLLFYGQQLLLHRLYELPTVLGLAMVVGVMLVCIIINLVMEANGLMEAPSMDSKEGMNSLEVEPDNLKADANKDKKDNGGNDLAYTLDDSQANN